MVLDLLQGVGQIQFFQCRAAVESTAADHRQFVIKTHIGQAVAAIEGAAADGCDLSRQNDCFQRLVAGKRTGIDGLNDIAIDGFRDHNMHISAQIAGNGNAGGI